MSRLTRNLGDTTCTLHLSCGQGPSFPALPLEPPCLPLTQPCPPGPTTPSWAPCARATHQPLRPLPALPPPLPTPPADSWPRRWSGCFPHIPSLIAHHRMEVSRAQKRESLRLTRPPAWGCFSNAETLPTPPTRSEFLAAQQTRYLEQPEACTAAHRIPQQKQKARQP